MFRENWNDSGSKVATLVSGPASAVLDRIIEHVTAGDTDPHTVQTVAAARTMTGLTENVEAGLQLLAQQLPYLTIRF